jgi:hypothetical protein
MVTQILRKNGDNASLSQRWVTQFLQRNPHVHSIVSRSIAAERAIAANPELINAFFELFERTRLRLGIHFNHIYNIDETGIALGVCDNANQRREGYAEVSLSNLSSIALHASILNNTKGHPQNSVGCLPL